MTSVCVDSRLADMHRAEVSRDISRAEHAEVVRQALEIEVRSIVARASVGERVKLPRVAGGVAGLPAQVVYTYGIDEAIAEAVADPDDSSAVDALITSARDGIAPFFGIVVSKYLAWIGDDIVECRLGGYAYDAAEQRAFDLEESFL